MKALNRKLGLGCVLVSLAACGGKTDEDGESGATTNVGDGDGDGDATSSGDGDGDGDGDTGTDGPTSNGDKTASCRDLCEVAASCDTAADGCLESCVDNESVSNVGQEAISTCLADLSCTPAETELLEAVLCITEELEDEQLSAEQNEFCDVTSKNVQECTGEEPDTTLGDCKAQIGVVSDEVLAEVNGCTQTDCEQLEACVALQLLQAIDLNAITDMAETGEINAGGLGDMLALLVISSQLGGTSEDLPGVGGAFPAP